VYGGELADSFVETFRKIAHEAKSFTPSILMHGKKQIYWDIESYLHIVMRHVREYQLGDFKRKTPFPYKAEDLETLIEKILKSVEDEIKVHFSDHPSTEFYRCGNMGIEFNGDHYHLRIDTKGRLVQFHAVGS
jgi:hypothetical protein